MIRKACVEEGGPNYIPELIYIVVQQRTRCRLAKVQENGQIPNGSNGNVPCGTVVDEEIVSVPPGGKDPKLFGNFYMVSQYGLKGTARPSHYHVLENDAQITLDKIEQLTYDLCFLYARATKIVSRPAPVYYAHRAAFLAQYYEAGFKEASDYWEVGSTVSAGSNGSGGSRGPLPKIELEKGTASRVYFA